MGKIPDRTRGSKKPDEKRAKAPKKEKQSTKAEVVEGLIKNMEGKFAKGDMKPTVGDFLRLLQFQQDMAEGEPREVKAQWVEPTKTESDGGT